MLEARLHPASSFWTLTYDNDHLPPGGNLVPRHLQLFLKRLRKAAGPVRFFAVGEYGDETFRPHYHAALYGIDASVHHQAVSQSWSLGFTYGGTLTLHSAQYIAGYVTKKMTAHDDPRLEGRHPEFARMSLKPGIGAGAMPLVAEALNDSQGALLVARTGDVPRELRADGKGLPLGRYLRRKLRDEMGFSEIGGQEKAKADQLEEMRALYESSGATSTRHYKEVLKPYIEHQRILQVETKAKIWRKKGSL